MYEYIILIPVFFLMYSGLVLAGVFLGKYIAEYKHYEEKLKEEKDKTQPVDITRIISKVDGEEFITITKVEKKDNEEA